MPPDDLIAYQQYVDRSQDVIEAVRLIGQCDFPLPLHPWAMDLIVGWIRGEVLPRTLELYLHIPNSDYAALAKCLLAE